MAYQLKGEQNLNDIFMFLVSSTSFLRYLYFETSWDELKLCTVLVHLFCPLHCPFRDLCVSNANRTNPPEAKRSKLAPDALITLKTPRTSQAMLLLDACVPHSRVMCNEMELKNANFTLKLCWESLDETLFGYRGSQTVKAFKLRFKLLSLGVNDHWLICMTLYGTPGLSKSICFIICSSVPIICSAFLIRCGTPLVICAIYDFISCAFVVICSTFVVICYGFGTICGVCVIICSDFSIITTFCRSISTVLSLYRVVYALYGVQTILPGVHFALLAVLSSLYRTAVIIYPQCKVRVSDPSSSQPDAAILVYFRGKVES